MTSSEKRENLIRDIATEADTPVTDDAIHSIRAATEGRFVDSELDAAMSAPYTPIQEKSW